MGRPQEPLDRDGSPVREFAFWLRDLRNRSGLTYDKISKITHYGTSTLQAAASGERLPTLKVVVAFVMACNGDVEAWTAYWTQLRRILDPDAPSDAALSATPPWAGSNGSNVTELPAPPAPDDQADDETQADVLDKDGWYIQSFKAQLRLDVDPVEAIEQRVIVATRDGVEELATTICVPRHQDDQGASHQLDAELMHGGSLVLREQPYETFFRNVIALPKPLRMGEKHEYAMRLRLPPGQPMAAHYVHVPLRRSDSFELRVRFSPTALPLAVWRVTGVPNTVIYERQPPPNTISPDIFGEVRVAFQEMRVGLGYGLCWSDDQIGDIAS